MTEFVGDPNNPLPTPAIISGKQNPLLSLLPESVQAQASEVIKAVETGVKIYRAAESGIEQVQGIITAAKELKNDPAGLLHLVGDALGVAAPVLQNLNRIGEVTAVVGDLTSATKLAEQLGMAGNALGDTVASLRSGYESGSVGGWLDAAGSSIMTATEAMTNGALAVEILTGWLATRSDS